MRAKALAIGVCRVSLCCGWVLGAAAAPEAPSEALTRIEVDSGLGRFEEAADDPALPPGLTRARELKSRLAAGRAAVTAPAKTAKNVVVDCAKGQSLQAALDQNESPLDIEVRGLCQENVEIRGQRVTLHGSDPMVDGIRGVPGSATGTALSILYTDAAHIANLSINDGPGGGTGIWFSQVTMDGCQMIGNARDGLNVSANSSLVGTGLTLSLNARGLHAQRGSTAFCIGCVLEDNTGFAAVATRGGVLSLLSSVASGLDGIAAIEESSYADIDCLTEADTGHPCAMTATRRAAAAFTGTVALWGAGDFTGQVTAEERGHALLLGARQIAPGKNLAGADIPNSVSSMGTFQASPFFDEDGVAHESMLKGLTRVDAFGRALLDEATVIDGQVACSRAGDAWADPGVVLTPGSSIDGCEHAPPPAP